MRAGAEVLANGVKVNSLVLIHPYFLGGDSSESDEMGIALLRELIRLWPGGLPRDQRVRRPVDQPYGGRRTQPDRAGVPACAGVHRWKGCNEG
ncbi:hypothetical protein GUJ93_ZPchr0009g1883 [Zizania palustris]|uniref:Uncharacterized protein n=1 Tax=Zizania palustris TaxID=103762 RepID=A0A8J5V773_ZIZPA|nr:hypothetical protein GUJ93_ZPchr0009g1883 [Zizania palustris]